MMKKKLKTLFQIGLSKIEIKINIGNNCNHVIVLIIIFVKIFKVNLHKF